MTKKRRRVLQVSPGERRKRGTRIKGGLGELGDLDAVEPPKTRARVHVRPDVLASDCATAAINAANDSKATAASVSGDKSSLAPLRDLCSSHACVFGHDWEEWRRVKRLLFHTSDDAPGAGDDRRSALNIIERVWQARARKKRPLPAYVEATALLMEAKLFDEEGRLLSFAAATFYGAAISRALHLMTGTFARGAADTYRKRARLIGLPEEAVEVRQRVAHGSPPLLSELRWVCGLLLQFLFRRYWMEQERHVRVMERLEEEEESTVDTGRGQRTTHSATVEEMRQLLEELSDSAVDDSGSVSGDIEVFCGCWRVE